MDTMNTNVKIPANDVLFEDFCVLLNCLHNKKKDKQEQERILLTYINDFRLNTANITVNKNSTFCPILRLLLPQCDRKRGAYNLKESKLGALLVKVFSIKQQSPDAQKLLNFRAATSNSNDTDFAGVAYFILKSRFFKTSGNYNIGDINSILDKIATPEVGNKATTLDEIFTCFIKNSTPNQFKWFLRIILKDLKLGMGIKRILSMFHPDAPDLYDKCSNLYKVCKDLEEDNTIPLEMGVQIFYAVSPMLSERLDITHVSKLTTNKMYQVETKFDGERFQIHMRGGTFEYFSRKGYTYSDHYGKTYKSGSLTPYLKDCFSPEVFSFILDGEMMGWHKERQCFGSKGMSYDIKKITEKSNYRPCFCAFDVLYCNGMTLIGPPDKGGMPLNRRLKLLDTMFTDIPGVIQHSKRQYAKDSSEILDALNKAIEDQEEGIVVKDVESYYEPSRRNAGWYKIKPEYTENPVNDLDLVIIGADEAADKKHGKARSFLLACADDIAEPGETLRRWVSVGWVSSGLTFEEREQVCSVLERHWTLSKRTPAPSCLYLNKEKPDFWILPEHSIVVQVRATELVKCKSFGTEFTLRFPRIVKIREDKPVKDIMTLQEFNQLCADKGLVVKLSDKQVNPDTILGEKVKIPEQLRRKRKAETPQVAKQFRHTVENREATEEKVLTSKALLGRKICILSDDEDCNRDKLVKIVESHGGKIDLNPGKDTWCCVVGQMTLRSQHYIKSESVDVVPTSWLRSLPPSNQHCVLSPMDMLATKTSTKLNMRREYDVFGDSYTQFTDVDTLKKCFDRMDNDDDIIYLTTQEKLTLDKQFFPNNNPFSFLRACFIHIVCKRISVNALRAKMYAATICDIDCPNLTHVVISDKTEYQAINDIKTQVKNVHIVTEDWLEACLSEKKLISETKYLLKL